MLFVFQDCHHLTEAIRPAAVLHGRITDSHDTVRIRLHYYNNTLLEKGIITETQHRRMKAQINGRKRSVSERSER